MSFPTDYQSAASTSEESAGLQLETIDCPLCGGERFRVVLTGVDRFHHVGSEFRIVRCAECGHAYLNPRPELADIIKCYPSDYGPYHAKRSNAEQPAGSASELPAKPWYLKRWVRSIPGLRAVYYWLTDDRSTFTPEISSGNKRALEIGCSTGEFLLKLQAEGWDVQGIELAEEPAEKARRRGLSVQTGTLESATLESESFEAVFLYMVLEHLHDPRRALQEIHRVLVPGGWLVFSVPNFGCWERFILGDYSLGIQLPRHLQHFTVPTLRSLLADCQFEDVRIHHQRNVNNLVAGLGLWLHTKVPRWGIGQRLIDFTDAPTFRGTLVLSPLAKMLGFLRQGGRLTVTARKPGELRSNRSR